MELITIHNTAIDSYEPTVFENGKVYSQEDYIAMCRRRDKRNFMLQLIVLSLIMLVRAWIFMKYNV